MGRRVRNPKTPRAYEKKAAPFKKSSAQALLFMNAILWTLYAVYIILDMRAVKNNTLSVVIVGFFIAMNVIAMLAAGVLITRKHKPVYYFAILVIVANTALALTNLRDFFYIIALIFDLLILGVLFSLRRDYIAA